MKKLSIIFPAYNEEKNLKLIEKELFPIIKNIDAEVIFVDDGSKDNTVKKIKQLQKKRKNIILLIHKENQGMGAAIRTAIPRCSSKFTITMDSDLTFHPRHIPKLLNKIEKENVDCIIGSPFIGGFGKNLQWYRIALSKGVNLIYNVLLGQKITAVSPILRIYKTKQLQELELESNKFEINAEILAKLLIKKRKVIEIPAKLTKRKYGESKLNNFKETMNHLKLMSKIVWWKIKK